MSSNLHNNFKNNFGGEQQTMAQTEPKSFYKSKRWQIKRQQILRRDRYLCVECSKYGRRVDATTIHHIKPLEHFPELAFVSGNLVSLCEKCHNRMHPEKGGTRFQKADH